jgi:hypothetical protein
VNQGRMRIIKRFFTVNAQICLKSAMIADCGQTGHLRSAKERGSRPIKKESLDGCLDCQT